MAQPFSLSEQPLRFATINRVQTEPTAVQQAMALLQGRLLDARGRRDRLADEITTIENALNSLSVYAEPSDVAAMVEDAAVLAPVESDGPVPSVRAAVKAILDSENRSFTPVEVRDLLPSAVVNSRTKEQRINSVRTAMWTLRDKGEAVRVDDSHTISARWAASLPSTNPELPVESDAGSSASVEAAT